LEIGEDINEGERQRASQLQREQRDAAVRAERERIAAEAAEQRRQQQVAAEAAAAAAREARRDHLVPRFGSQQADAIIAREVLVGMTPEAVRESIGQPRRIERVAAGEEMWIYDSVRVVFLNNRVTFVRR